MSQPIYGEGEDLLEKINGLFLVSSVNPPIDAKIL
jgi:hypothetical protein